MPSLPLSKCSGCGACAQACPKSAVLLLPNDEGFLYPEVKKELCAECNLCEKICPVNIQAQKNSKKNARFSLSDSLKAQGPLPPFSKKEAFAAFVKDENLRKESSSGGVFSALAEKTIETGGVVFGAEFDSSFSVRHGFTESSQGLEKFRGSKYLQSRTERTFIECKNFLDEGRKVLYTGTPCQIAGLKSFLRKSYENLLTADFICHGVPSPALWKKYIEYREKKAGSATVRTAKIW